MIERIEGLPDGIDGVRCEGKITRGGLRRGRRPTARRGRARASRVALLVELDGFDGITPDAAFEDIRLGWQAMDSFEAAPC